jgi:hypothetical protein
MTAVPGRMRRPSGPLGVAGTTTGHKVAPLEPPSGCGPIAPCGREPITLVAGRPAGTGGEVSWPSTPGQGATVSVSVPC